jgi:DNA-binding MarR family transcriptional regulator
MDYDKELYILRLMQQVFSSLTSVSNKIQAKGDKCNENLTSRQYMTILAILHLPEEETTIINVANKLGVTKQNVTQIINSLEKKDFVSITPSRNDKRSVNLKITDIGIKTLVKCSSDFAVDFMADIFKSLTTEELESLWILLKKIYSFDGVEFNGFEEDIQIPDTLNSSEIKEELERFHEKRNAKRSLV